MKNKDYLKDESRVTRAGFRRPVILSKAKDLSSEIFRPEGLRMTYETDSSHKPFGVSRGFTLIEILLVVIIIGILVSLVAPRLAGRSEEARIQAAKADIDGGLSLALDMYEVDNGTFPQALEDLARKPSSAPNWKGPYLKKGVPKDPWSNEYSYRIPGQNNPTGYDLFSAGPDKQPGTQDDITNWKSESPY